MPNPDIFDLTSDFSSLKIDGSITQLSVTFPSSVTVAGNSSVVYTTDLVIGTIGSNFRARSYGSKFPSSDVVGVVRDYRRNGFIGSTSTYYDVRTYLYRISPSTIRLVARFDSPYNDNFITESGAETFTYTITTFKSPFS